MKKTILKYLPFVAMATIPTLLIWLPFFVRMKTFWTIPLPQSGMATIVSNYDGPLYLVVSKTLYNIEAIKTGYQFPLPAQYYAAHFPLFPFLIRLLSPVLGYPYSMLFITILSSVLALSFFYKLARNHLNRDDAIWLTSVFSVFPARWLIVRSVGSPEPLFVASIIASVYFFRKKKYLTAGLWGVVAQTTKSAGLLLFVAYLLILTTPYLKRFAASGFKKLVQLIKVKSIYPIFLIPVSLVAVFVLYGFAFGDFFAYFKSGDNIHLFFPPFQIFNFSTPWVGTFWLEEVIFIYMIGAIGIYKLYQQKLFTYFWFCLVFFASILFVAHRDVLRYALPIVPFLLIAYKETLIKKEFKIAMAVVVIPIYLYSLAFISQNTMQISNWTPFL